MGLNHADVLNKLLAESCPQRAIDSHNNVYQFYIEAHCVGMTVIAEFLKRDLATDKYYYEILDVKYKDI